MKRIFIELTDHQRKQLKPLFDLVVERNIIDCKCGIGAQVFPDGLHVKFFEGEQAEALAVSLGGKFEPICSAKAAYDQGVEIDAVEKESMVRL